MNAYLPGEGLKPHVDLAAFDDGVCVVSLLSSTVMDLSPAPEELRDAIPPSGTGGVSSEATSRSGSASTPGTLCSSPGTRGGGGGTASRRARRMREPAAARTNGASGVSVALRTLREEGRELRVDATARASGVPTEGGHT